MRVTHRAALFCIFALAFSPAHAADPIRVALLKFGTVNWELDVIRQHRLDEKHGFRIEPTEFAGTQATTLALQGGAADMIVTDWLWVSRQRGTGADFTMLPYSSALGAIMVSEASGIRTLADLKGKRLGVAGGPLDKSWLMLRAHSAKTIGFDIGEASQPVYAAPPLLSEKLAQGELDAVLTYWHFAARLEARGFRRLLGMDEVATALGGGGSLAMIGYTFRDSWAEKNRAVLDGFRQALKESRAIMASSDAEWQRLAPLTQASDEATLRILRDRYRQGLPGGPANDAAAARAIFAIIAGIGGAELTGGQSALAPGTFWEGGGM